jgi:hypothetical protein
VVFIKVGMSFSKSGRNDGGGAGGSGSVPSTLRFAKCYSLFFISLKNISLKKNETNWIFQSAKI